jgi:signal transduction histidine kinase
MAQDELESHLDPDGSERTDAGKNYESYKIYKTCRHPQELEEIMTPREVETLRRMACLREITGLREVATPGEIAGLREAAASRDPQLIRGLDMRGWLAAPITSGVGGYGRNLGLIQLSEKHDGEFTEQDEATLAKLARIVSVAVENRLRWHHEQNLREAAERAARAKDEYMAMTSYKLRAQLNTLLGWSWVLRRQADNMEDVARAAEIIERAARTQAQLVEDLLGASRKGAVIWKRGGDTEERRGGGIAGWAEEEAEVWMEPSAEGRWEKKTEEWADGDALDFSDAPAFRHAVAPSLRSAGRHSPKTSRGLAAGGC